MIRMKKGLAALAAACFLFAGMEKAQAVVGIPDDVPGSTLLYPFFKVTPTRTGNQSTQDTLFVATNTDTQTQIVHFVLWSVSSQHVYDFNVTLTGNDVFSCSLYDLILGSGCSNEGEKISPAPSSVATRLKDTASGLLLGYVTGDTVVSRTSLLPTASNYPRDFANVLIGHEYIVDLPLGSATGLNAVSIEYADTTLFPADGHPAVPFTGIAANNITATGFFTSTDGLERLDGREGDLAQTRDADTNKWWEIVRYFTISAPGIAIKSELWLWKDTNNPNLFVNLEIFDEAENLHSISIELPFEVNFRNVGDLITPGAPGGWFRIPFAATAQSVAFSLQLANDKDAKLRWDAIFPAHRQYTDYR
ncbi:MAG: hypothetical protein EXR78_02055 [Deltaproteobacteria bacterium]|nr:hypothetical protein [Deltaproteobacteria bacterium]